MKHDIERNEQDELKATQKKADKKPTLEVNSRPWPQRIEGVAPMDLVWLGLRPGAQLIELKDDHHAVLRVDST
jgi:hypothetical protein